MALDYSILASSNTLLLNEVPMKEIKSEIEQIEELKLKEVKTVGELIDILQRHKKIFDTNPSYYRCMRAGE